MLAVASAPSKAILFGEHSVVYNQPAIAGAINKRSTIKIKESTTGYSIFKSGNLNFKARLDIKNKSYKLINGTPGIIRYVLEVLNRFHSDGVPIEVSLNTQAPIGSGLGSSASVTVATLAAIYRFHDIKFTNESLAHDAHQIEQAVQGIASPLDTLVSTYGGIVYLSKKKNIERFKSDIKAPFVIGYTNKYGNTGKMVKDVRRLKQNNSKVVNSIILSMGHLTGYAKEAIINGDLKRLGELMNINQGLLDALGVNTPELSRMVYAARQGGAIGSKITGAGGGGSIIALCPGRVDEVSKAISRTDRVLSAKFSKKGVSSRVYYN